MVIRLVENSIKINAKNESRNLFDLQDLRMSNGQVPNPIDIVKGIGNVFNMEYHDASNPVYLQYSVDPSNVLTTPNNQPMKNSQ